MPKAFSKASGRSNVICQGSSMEGQTGMLFQQKEGRNTKGRKLGKLSENDVKRATRQNKRILIEMFKNITFCNYS